MQEFSIELPIRPRDAWGGIVEGELAFKIARVVLDEALLLQEVDEHQAVE